MCVYKIVNINKNEIIRKRNKNNDRILNIRIFQSENYKSTFVLRIAHFLGPKNMQKAVHLKFCSVS